jgi:ribulose-phosphate 3-epimerase
MTDLSPEKSSIISVCPSMLSADPTCLGQELLSVEKAGAGSIHWDIMDGSFVDAITFGAHIVAAHRKMTSLRFDAHLMIENPEKHIAAFASAGADVIIVHAESCHRVVDALQRIKDLGKFAGIAIKPTTTVDAVAHCLDFVDIVLVMSVNPGRSGQTFMTSQLEKISELRKIIPPTKEICVDGGINDITAAECISRGANSLVAGSFLFKHEDYVSAIKAISNFC